MSAVTVIPNGVAEIINDIASRIHRLNHSWWVDMTTGVYLPQNVGEKLMLVVSELSEAMEGHRKDLMDDKLPHRKMLEVEIADAIIRLLDFSAGFRLDVGGALVEKLEYNRTRPDHKIENRTKEGGKKY